jgi:hypothetical protein
VEIAVRATVGKKGEVGRRSDSARLSRDVDSNGTVIGITEISGDAADHIRKPDVLGLIPRETLERTKFDMNTRFMSALRIR